MVKLFCALVGVSGRAFEVDIDDSASASALKDVIMAKNTNRIQCDAMDLQLFLAKKNNLWLQSRSDDVKKLDVGETTAAIEELTHEEKELDPTETLRDLFGDITTKGTIYVLVVVPSGFDLIIGETTSGTLDRNELEYYQQRGQVIRSNCHSYCEEILQQVTSHYKT